MGDRQTQALGSPTQLLQFLLRVPGACYLNEEKQKTPTDYLKNIYLLKIISFFNSQSFRASFL